MTFKEQEEYWFNEYVMAIGRMTDPRAERGFIQKTSEFATVCHAQYLIFEALAEKNSCK